MFPSTRATASICGFIAGGSGGVGSITWGGLRDFGNVLRLRVLTMEAEPRKLELTGQELHKAVHAYGTNGIIIEAEMPLTARYDWVEAIVGFDSFAAAAAICTGAGDNVGGVPDRVPVFEFEGDVVQLSRLRVLHEGDVMRLHPAGEPDRQQPVGHVDALGAGEVERLLEEVESLLDVGPVEERVVETARGHAVRLEVPDVRVMDAGLRLGLLGMSVELDAMARGNGEADAPSDSGCSPAFT